MTYTPIIINHVLIDGRYRSDVRVEEVRQTIGLTNPATAIIAAPLDKFLKQPWRKGQTVVIYLDVLTKYNIKFAGVIKNRIADRGADYSYVYYECIDLRYLLNAAVVGRDFNFNRDLYGENEHLTFSGICRKIIEQFNDDYSVNFKLRTGGLDTVEAPEMLLKGSSVASALENIAAMGGAQQKARWYVEYLSVDQLRLSVTHKRTAMRRRINFATDKSKKFNVQPHGWPMPSRILENQDSGDFINRIVIKGSRRKVQTTLTLTKGWDTSYTTAQTSAVLEAFDHYSSPSLPDGTTNSEYIPGASRFGTHYWIPQVSLTGNSGAATAMVPQISSSLVQDDFVSTNKPLPVGAFLVFYYSPETLYVKTDGFTIHNGVEVILSEPLYSITNSSGTIQYIVPAVVYLVCAIIDTVHLESDTGQTGSEPWVVTREIFRPEFKWLQYNNTYYLDSSGNLQYSSGTTDIQKDDTEIDNVAAAYVKELQGGVQAYSLENETFISTWKPGDLVTSHYAPIDGLNIAGITYTVDSENARIMRATFEVMGANTDA